MRHCIVVFCLSDTVNNGLDRIMMYYLNDGVYGSLSCLINDAAHTQVEPYLNRVNITIKASRRQSTKWWDVPKQTSARDLKCGVNFSLNVCFSQVVESGEQRYRSVLWGPTCDSIDKVADVCWIPELRVGDWLLVDNMGAYSICSSTDFNGFERAHVYPVVTAKTWHTLNLSDFFNLHQWLGNTSIRHWFTEQAFIYFIHLKNYSHFDRFPWRFVPFTLC